MSARKTAACCAEVRFVQTAHVCHDSRCTHVIIVTPSPLPLLLPLLLLVLRSALRRRMLLLLFALWCHELLLLLMLLLLLL